MKREIITLERQRLNKKENIEFQIEVYKNGILLPSTGKLTFLGALELSIKLRELTENHVQELIAEAEKTFVAEGNK